MLYSLTINKIIINFSKIRKIIQLKNVLCQINQLEESRFISVKSFKNIYIPTLRIESNVTKLAYRQ